MERERDEIDVPVWYRGGTMMVRRDALPVEHPESTYNYIKNVLGRTPEEFGVFGPDACPNCGHVRASSPDTGREG